VWSDVQRIANASNVLSGRSKSNLIFARATRSLALFGGEGMDASSSHKLALLNDWFVQTPSDQSADSSCLSLPPPCPSTTICLQGALGESRCVPVLGSVTMQQGQGQVIVGAAGEAGVNTTTYRLLPNDNRGAQVVTFQFVTLNSSRIADVVAIVFGEN